MPQYISTIIKLFRPFLILLFIGSPITLNQTGYCYSEWNHLNERELVDRLLFADQRPNFDGKTIEGKDTSSLTTEQKVSISQQKSLGEYPHNCRISGTSTNGLYLLYHIDCVAPKDSTHPKRELYSYKMYQVDGCGKRLKYMGDTLYKNSSYLIQVEHNKRYWERH